MGHGVWGKRVSAALLGVALVGTAVGTASAAPTTWAIEASPNHAGFYNELDDVACTSPTWCMAVGYVPNGAAVDAIGMRWDGVQWKLATPRSRKSSLNYITHVACTGPTFCLAIGSSQLVADGAPYTALIEQWNGTHWSIVRNPPGTASGIVRDVSCPDATTCYLVGDAAKPWFARWNGSTLSLVRRSGIQSIEALTCTGATTCVAVGGLTETNDLRVQTWDGAHWTSSGAPNPGADSLSHVACGSATNCIAIGTYNDDGHYALVVETWNGTSWTQQPSPLTGNEGINDITCPAANDCVAVGAYAPVKFAQTLVLSWNGSDWSRQYPPNAGHFSNALEAVSCTSSTACRAVGFWTHDHMQETLAVAGS